MNSGDAGALGSYWRDVFKGKKIGMLLTRKRDEQLAGRHSEVGSYASASASASTGGS